jgi:hypothetical protein
MTPGLRKFALTAHVNFAVGWLGAVLAYLDVAIAGLVRRDAQVAQSGLWPSKDRRPARKDADRRSKWSIKLAGTKHPGLACAT